MILILSIDQDETTTEVIRWLMHKGEDFIRINKEHVLDSLTVMENGKVVIEANGQHFMLDDFSAYWYRRGNFYFPALNFEDNDSNLGNDDEHSNNDEKLANASQKFYTNEQRVLQQYFHTQLKQIPKTISPNYQLKKINKLNVLADAQKVGLLTPPTIVTTSLTTLKSFKETHGQIITKVLSSPISYYEADFWLPMYTEEVSDETIEQLPIKFGLSFFQKKIIKKYEIRTFFFKDTFHSMAIFSQLDDKTATDFRKYNHQSPNRTVPFNLPKDIENKLLELMKSQELDTGSIDLMVDEENNYYFLEINPIGQFGMVSKPCNYYLEEKVAQYLGVEKE